MARPVAILTLAAYPGSQQPINTAPQKTSSDPWDFDMLSPSSSPNVAQPATVPINRVSSPFDVFDDLEATTRSASKLDISNEKKPASQPSTNVDFDDDILGLLGKPVSAAKVPASVVAPRPSRKSPEQELSSPSTSSRPPSRPTAARTPSPPPHILGEVVSMGFSVQQARLALAATLGAEQPGQWSIPAAMDILASDGAAHAARERETEASQNRPFESSREDDEAYLRRQGQRNAHKQAGSRQPGSQRREVGRNGTALEDSSQSASDLTANDLLQQASVIGSSMLKSAGAYWKTSRAQLQKAIEEKKLAIPSVSGPSSGRSSPSSAKPRWMTEEANFDDDSAHGDIQSNDRTRRRAEGFRDIDNDRGALSQDALPAHPSERTSERSQQKRPEQASIPALRLEQTHEHRRNGVLDAATHPHSASLLGVTKEEKRVYASPNRRKVAAASSAPVSAVPPRSPAAVPPKPNRPPRPRVAASPAQLEASRKYRLAGNEHFKLGRYGEAVNAYTSALESLPEGHLGRIAALNNRANARLKNGEERQAAEDATAVLTILASPTEVQKMTREVWEVILHDFTRNPPQDTGGEKFDAHDVLGKALSRRAKGYEGCEKWRLAMLDWQMITELGDSAVVKSAGGMRVISEGLSRCRKVVEPPSSKPVTATAPKRAAQTRVPIPSTSVHSDAVDKLRETNKRAEADEAERLSVKDAVDAKITGWRAGKETNLRALIASLDNVLWEELGWKKVGMHELISDSQLKVKYVRAISKVHPDKVSDGAPIRVAMPPKLILFLKIQLGPDVPVERQLIANAVFGTLSDAWNAHTA